MNRCTTHRKVTINMNYQAFVQYAISQRVSHLLQETTVYPGLAPLTQLYLEKHGRLIGSYSAEHGGVILTKPSVHWSKSGRTFKKVYL